MVLDSIAVSVFAIILVELRQAGLSVSGASSLKERLSELKMVFNIKMMINIMKR